MIVKLMIRTAPGYAESTQKKIQPFILGVRKIKHEVYANKEDDTIIWVIDGQVKDIMRITKNAARFDVTMARVLKSKGVRKAAKLSEEDKDVLDTMIKHQTSIRVIKRDEDVNITRWQKIKDKFL